MESTARWNRLCAAIAVAPLDAGAAPLWAWLTHYDVVPNAPSAFEHFVAAYREVVRKVESPHGWPTGPSVAAVFSSMLMQHGVITDFGHGNDPHGEQAKLAFDAWQGSSS